MDNKKSPNKFILIINYHNGFKIIILYLKKDLLRSLNNMLDLIKNYLNITKIELHNKINKNNHRKSQEERNQNHYHKK